jgi:hypothetical protein
MDKTFGPAWHCCVGKDFGSSVTYNNKNFLYLYTSNKAIMIFKHWFYKKIMINLKIKDNKEKLIS